MTGCGVWGAKWPSIGFAVDNREAWPLSYNLGLVGGAGGSLSRLGHFGHSQAEGPAGCRESVPATAVARAAPPAPAVALAQCGSTVLDLRQSMVRWRNSLLIVKPETVLRWHRRGWRAYWSWRSNRQHRRIGRRRFPSTFRPSSGRWLLRTGPGVKKESKPNSQDWDLRFCPDRRQVHEPPP